MNKKGYIKTLEAVIAIVAILVFTFGVTPRETPNPNQVPFVVKNAEDFITSTLANNDNMRQFVLNADPDEKDSLGFLNANLSIDMLVINNLPTGYSYEFKICKETTCLAENPPLEASVYSDDVIIAGVDEDDKAKVRIVRFWFWSLG